MIGVFTATPRWRAASHTEGPASTTPAPAGRLMKAYRHPLVGLLELHQEKSAVPDASGTELVALSAVPGTPAEEGLLRLLRLRLSRAWARTERRQWSSSVSGCRGSAAWRPRR
ncbi:hypothetical protein [Streptomyces sp. NPDC059761]|uniref:MmyB family transcriptional regulator n=1 Tax=Streptomyces sp. NPDC059761 TaxID=3346937 RepID=UPI00365DF460